MTESDVIVAILVGGLLLIAAWFDRRPLYREVKGRGQMMGETAREENAHLDHYFPPVEDES